MTKPIPPHGTHARYKGTRTRPGCRCADCTHAAVREDKARTLDRHRGNPRRVSSAPARAHVETLRASKMLDVEIMRAAGIPTTTCLSRLLGQDHLYRATAQRLLSVKPNQDRNYHLVSSVGAMRRVQALQVLGWDCERIGQAIGIGNRYVSRLANGEFKRISANVDASIKRLYSTWSTSQGPSVRAANRAQRRGWSGPLDWNDIDNPNEQPEVEAPQQHIEMSQRQLLNELAQQRAVEIVHLARAGADFEQIAARVGVSPAHVRDQLRRKHRSLYLALTA